MADSQPKPIHPFPARMASSIPWSVLQGHTGLRVLDPMTGSGTTLVTARTLGHHGIGFDTDPLAILIARCWSGDADTKRVRRSGRRALRCATAAWRSIPLRHAYPNGADEETRAFTRYWFDATNRRQLTALASTIERTRDPGVRRLLWCAFSRLIITKQASASRALDLAHSRPHRVNDRKPIRPIDHFLSALETVLKRLPFAAAADAAPSAQAELGDARALPLPDDSIDVVITSPPYLNAIDYLRGHKFSLVWMGHTVTALRETRATNIGTEVAANAATTEDSRRALSRMASVDRLPIRQQGWLGRFARDMDAVIAEVHRVLKPGGPAVFVLGNSTLRGVHVNNAVAVAYLGRRHGLELESSSQRTIPPNRRYLPPPALDAAKTDLNKRMRTEVILTFRKPS